MTTTGGTRPPVRYRPIRREFRGTGPTTRRETSGSGCADWYGEDYYRQSPERDPRGPEGGSYRVYRGGSWWNADPAIHRGASRIRGGPGSRYVFLGLRLVRTA